MLCGLADCLDALVAQGAQVRRIVLVGGGARSQAVRAIAPAIFGAPVLVPPRGEFAADGAARQAAWVMLGSTEPPEWTIEAVDSYEADPTPDVREAYARARDHIVERREP